MFTISQELYQRQERFRERAQTRVRHVAKKVIRRHSRRVNMLQRGILRGSRLRKEE